MRLQLLIAGLSCHAGALACAPVVTTTHGALQGGKCPGNQVNYFASIPYAKPPIGDLRFADPQPYGHFGKRNATVRAPACPQFGTLFVEDGLQVEDCLFLDIWTPANATEKSRLPVKIWLYGGGDETGGISNPLYDGCTTATDSIIVSINYRVGPLGFLSLLDAHLNGNYGIKDIMLGLKWIKKSIYKFGGNPDHILLFGQSAGALDAQIIAALPDGPSLISAAVMMSSGGNIPSISEADAWSRLFVSGLNCGVSDVDCLRGASVADMNSTVLHMPELVGSNIGTPFEHLRRGLLQWGPVIDGTLISAPLAELGVKVPSMFGSTTDEGTIFVLGEYQERFAALNQSDYDFFLNSHFGELAPLVNTTYAASKFAVSQTAPNAVAAAIAAIHRDSVFRCPAYRGLLAGLANHVPVFTYSFGHLPSCTWLTDVPQSSFIHAFLGPTHTADIPFVFNHLNNLPLQGNPDNCTLTPDEAKMSNFMRSAWTEMAVHGEPGHGWGPFTLQKPVGVNFANSTFSVGEVDYEICSFWNDMESRYRNLTSGAWQG
ncbi:hypothetical protein NLG97_g1593 [Lecanicillium saksenae]|uniref:Uncharacterized protein n=1 Tax=Lecanicillium saksenae TaxID=468837 RepID=A0ACC1R7F8_9HYPO|nr:hypothetical protein NLG97_g1593 [Lecanicillium saksenae]